MWGAFSPLPLLYPPIPLATFDEDSLDDIVLQKDFERMEGARVWAEKLDIAGYIQACATTHITFTEWIGIDDHFYKKYGYPDMFREALKRESKRVVDDANRKREEEINRIKFDSQKVNAHSSIMGSSGPVDKIFNSNK